MGEDEYPIYLNVGHAKNGDGYHLYDITKTVGEVEKQTSVFERVNDLRSKNDLPTNDTVPKHDPTVKNQYSFSSPKTDTAPIGAEDFDVQPKSESNPELEKMLSDHDFVKDADDAVRTLAEHRAEKSTVDVKTEYKNATDSKLMQFIKDARNGLVEATRQFVLSKVHKREAVDIKRLTGIDVSDYSNVFRLSSLQHIDKDHGIEGKTDKSMSDIEDIARINYVIENYDSIELLPDPSQEYRDKEQKPAPMVKLTKEIEGTHYVVLAVPDATKKVLPVVSAYKKEASVQTGDVQASPSNVRNASAANASEGIVAETALDVKADAPAEVEAFESEKGKIL